MLFSCPPRTCSFVLVSHCLLLLLALSAAVPACARLPSEWRGRSVYQLLTDRFALPPPSSSTSACANDQTYCGGTWSGVLSRLDYIAELGFNAIWISPVVANAPGGYHGYWMTDPFAVNSHFGSAADLKALVAACHARDIWVMADVVANHMADVNFAYSTLSTFNSPQHYHDCSICDANCNIPNSAWTSPPNLTIIEHCQLEGLSDLNQDNSFVRQTLLTWISQLVANYSLDGLRIDTAEEVKLTFWSEFQTAAGVYAVGEIFDSNVALVAGYQGALTATLSYPLYFTLNNVFASKQSMTQLTALLSSYQQLFADPSVLGVFLENHDNRPHRAPHTHGLP